MPSKQPSGSKPQYTIGERVDVRCKCGHTDLENTTIVDCMPVSPADQMFLMVILGMRIEFFYRVSDTKQPIPEHWIRRPFDKMMTNLKKKRAVEEVH